MDRVSSEKRSANMARIRSKNTKPEIRLRRVLHGMGMRYRLHSRKLPGSPDIVFVTAKTAVFVHGCYWHRHEGCSLTTSPKSNLRFWEQKFEGNKKRDRKTRLNLERAGWRVIIVWECQTRNEEVLRKAALTIRDATLLRRDSVLAG